MKCPDCNGKGRWTERIEYDGNVEMHSMFCGTCKGTGIYYDPEDDDNPKNVFDVGGKDDE